MDLYLWKAPVTDDEEEAGKLLALYFDNDEKGVFEPSPAIAAAAGELLRLYPYWPVSGEDLLVSMSDEVRGKYTEEGLADLLKRGSYGQAEDGPWSDLPFDQTENMLALSIRWGADGKVLDDILRVGREHDLLIYDPQGPSIYLPTDPAEPPPDEPVTILHALKILPLAALLCGLAYLAWLIPIGWIRWPAVIVAGFIASAGLFVFFLVLGHALGLIKDEPPR